MVSAGGEQKKERSKAIDKLLVLVASLVVAVVGTAAFWIAADYHVSPAWLFGASSAAIFFAAVGWGYRRRFRSPEFSAFFVLWMAVHVAICVLVLNYLGLFYYFPILIAELWAGYTFAIWRFGPPPDPSVR